MTIFLLGKVIRASATVLLALAFTFCLLRFAGDPALAFLGVDATPEAYDLFREKYGLNDPLPKQFFFYIGNILSGDFGVSLRDGRPVTQVVFDVIPKTIQLMGVGFLLAMIIGLPAGIFAALRQGQWIDRIVMTVSVFGFSIPNFFLGLVLILTLTMWLRILPSGGSGTLAHMVMPIITLTTALMGIVARYARASMLTVLEKPFLGAATARGFPSLHVLWRHAIPNAAIPIVTISGLIFGSLLSGAAVIETVFSWPGMGRLLVISVLSKDLPVVQFIVIILTIIMVLTNLAIDLSYRILDPRVRNGGPSTRRGAGT